MYINCLLFLFLWDSHPPSPCEIKMWDIHPPSPHPSSAITGYTIGTLFYIGQITRNKRKALFRISEIHVK
jgi:hypothetical protein